MNRLFFIILFMLISIPCFASVNFSGDIDYINFGSNSNLNPASQTVSLWFRGSSFPNAYNVTYSRIASSTVYFQLFVTSASKIAVYVRGTGANVSVDPGINTLSTDVWYHYLASYSAASGLAVYINGVSEGTSGSNGDLNQGSGSAYIGEDTLTSGRNWSGDITEVAVWNRVLTTTEIDLLSKSRKKRIPLQIPSGLVSYWPLDEGSTGSSLSTSSNFYKDLVGTNHGVGVDSDGDSTNSEEALSYP